MATLQATSHAFSNKLMHAKPMICVGKRTCIVCIYSVELEIYSFNVRVYILHRHVYVLVIEMNR